MHAKNMFHAKAPNDPANLCSLFKHLSSVLAPLAPRFVFPNIFIGLITQHSLSRFSFGYSFSQNPLSPLKQLPQLLFRLCMKSFILSHAGFVFFEGRRQRNLTIRTTREKSSWRPRKRRRTTLEKSRPQGMTNRS